MIKKGSCKLCNYIGVETHMHHIIPRSRGGADDDGNLIELCSTCHNKAHNAEFGGDNGIIKHGIKKTKDRNKRATNWVAKHEDVLHDILMGFYDEEGTSVITDMLYYDVIKAEDLHTWLKFGKGNRYRSFGNVPAMLRRFYNTNKHLYKLDLSEDLSKF